MKKHSKADQKKIVNRYIKKCAEFSLLTNEELVALKETKMSSTDALSLRDVINKKMMEMFTNKKVEEVSVEKQKEETKNNVVSTVKIETYR